MKGNIMGLLNFLKTVSTNNAGLTYKNAKSSVGTKAVNNVINKVNSSSSNSGYGTYSSAVNNSDTNSILSQVSQLAEYNTAKSIEIMREQNQFNHDEAELDRNWQEQMSNTAHQREVKDLLSAGLNPILSANNSGASTGSGAQASASQNAQVDTSASGVPLALATSAMQAKASIAAAQASASAQIKSAQIASTASQLNNLNNIWASIEFPTTYSKFYGGVSKINNTSNPLKIQTSF